MFAHDKLKEYYLSNIVLFILLLFVILYVIYNYKYIKNGKYFEGQIVKPIIITGILFLIVHMLITWDDDQIEMNQKEIVDIDIPKYKLDQNINKSTNEILALKLDNQTNSNPNMIIKEKSMMMEGKKKYKIINNSNNSNKSNKLNNSNNSNNDIFIKSNENRTNLSNHDIFVNKKTSKYGLKFM